MVNQLASAYLIHQRPFSDSQVLLDVLVEHVGLVRMLARIKGRHAIKLKAQLQPFSRLLINYSGQGDLKYLASFELSKLTIMKGINLYCGFYINELCQRLLSPSEPMDDVFELYQSHLTALSNSNSVEPILRSFEFQLLERLGVGIDFYEDAEGNELEDRCYYQYRTEIGWLPLAQQGKGLSGAQIKAIADYDFRDVQTRRLAKQLARYLLMPLLGYKDLKSRELFGKR